MPARVAANEYEESLQLLSEMARKGSVTAAVAIERALRGVDRDTEWAISRQSVEIARAV